MAERNERKEEQDRVKPERMDHLEKGAEIGKSREKKRTEDKKGDK